LRVELTRRSTAAPESAQKPVPAIARSKRIGHWQAQAFSPWNPEQTLLLPQSPSDWLTDVYQVYFLLDLVDELGLSSILIPAQSKDPRVQKGFDPRM
jgi:hypothetical protein